jgi:2-keto-3-deoxy-L-rhamnonate aldolase RhmA
VGLLLLKKDADVDGIDARCDGAADLAAANGHPVISGFLKAHKRGDTTEKKRKVPGCQLY